MVVVKLIGGLGNQMFQYATGLALAKKHNTELFLDTEALRSPAGTHSPRIFELDHFAIKASIAGATQLNTFDLKSSGWLNRIKLLFPNLFSKLIFNENKPNFQKVFLKLPPDTYLNGYWQDARYFDHIRKDLMADFELKEENNSYLQLKKQILENTSVSIHVRRGDYVSFPAAAEFHGNLSLDYYKKAMQAIESTLKHCRYFMFSDDPSWCEEHFGFLKDLTIVSKNAGLTAQEELKLMSHCTHHIMANSSFSWWAAWLNQHDTKIVIAPAKWYSKTPTEKLGLKEPNWILIDNE